jgi:23S rRNA (guanosine2251-2'-O)-methyltransferase
MDIVIGFRAVTEAIVAGKNIDRLYIRKGLSGELFRDFFALIRERDLPYQFVPEEKLNRITLKNHQGVIALLAAVEYQSIEQLLPMIYEAGRDPFIVVLDGVTDVRNMGGIARTAECAGADAILIADKGAAQINEDAMKTSAGALLYIPVCRVRDLKEALVFLKSSGLRVVGATEKADRNCFSSSLSGPVAVLLGAEDTGISPEYLRLCDEKVRIPLAGKIGSLNVSAAAAVLLYEVVRQRISL